MDHHEVYLLVGRPAARVDLEAWSGRQKQTRCRLETCAGCGIFSLRTCLDRIKQDFNEWLTTTSLRYAQIDNVLPISLRKPTTGQERFEINCRVRGMRLESSLDPSPELLLLVMR